MMMISNRLLVKIGIITAILIGLSLLLSNIERFILIDYPTYPSLIVQKQPLAAVAPSSSTPASWWWQIPPPPSSSPFIQTGGYQDTIKFDASISLAGLVHGASTNTVNKLQQIPMMNNVINKVDAKTQDKLMKLAINDMVTLLRTSRNEIQSLANIVNADVIENAINRMNGIYQMVVNSEDYLELSRLYDDIILGNNGSSGSGNNNKTSVVFNRLMNNAFNNLPSSFTYRILSDIYNREQTNFETMWNNIYTNFNRDFNNLQLEDKQLELDTIFLPIQSQLNELSMATTTATPAVVNAGTTIAGSNY